MKKTDSYRVNEIFYSLQGEGHFTGTPAVFLRLAGCNRACSFCDTDHSGFTEMSADEVAQACAAFPGRHIVITGGEPLMQLDSALLSRLKERGFFVQIETNGSLPVPPEVDWVTCSPKDAPWNIDRVDELKVVFQGQDVEAIAARFPTPVRYLQPCSGLNTRETIQYILAHPAWRLSLQTHKLLDIR
ncbi:MAG: 7-carboxy-7-deazaguanine synthase QueE [Muribaculaceae bacterium]|nr:7-carboxy-7-deazaguanine synthase QueE [Muribaculaceae bacterium]